MHFLLLRRLITIIITTRPFFTILNLMLQCTFVFNITMTGLFPFFYFSCFMLRLLFCPAIFHISLFPESSSSRYHYIIIIIIVIIILRACLNYLLSPIIEYVVSFYDNII